MLIVTPKTTPSIEDPYPAPPVKLTIAPALEPPEFQLGEPTFQLTFKV
jgi:hypothetical protein